MQLFWYVKILDTHLDLICRFFGKGFLNHVLLNWKYKNAPNIITGSIYRVPNTNQKTFITLYDELIYKIRLGKKNNPHSNWSKYWFPEEKKQSQKYHWVVLFNRRARKTLPIIHINEWYIWSFPMYAAVRQSA